MNILLNGICGYMGREVEKLCKESYRGSRLIYGVDPSFDGDSTVPVYKKLSDVPSLSEVDCIVDFSNHTATDALFSLSMASRPSTSSVRQNLSIQLSCPPA